MKLLLKFIIFSLFLIVILLFFCNKEKFVSLNFTKDDNNNEIILKKNLFINYDEKEINNIIDAYSSNTDKKKSNEDSEDSNKSKKYDIPNSRKNNNRDITKNNLFINNTKSENNLNIENELCIGGYCMNSNILSIIGGYRDGPQFYAKAQSKTITLTSEPDKPIYYNHDNLIPMAKSVCINNKGKDDSTGKTIDNKTCLNARHFDMLNGSKGLRLYGGGMESPPDHGDWENTTNQPEDSCTTKDTEISNFNDLMGCMQKTGCIPIDGKCRTNCEIIKENGKCIGVCEFKDGKCKRKRFIEKEKNKESDYLMPYYIEYGKEGWGIDSTKTDLLYKKHDTCCSNNLILRKGDELKNSCLRYAFKRDAEASTGYDDKKIPIYRGDSHSCSHNGSCDHSNLKKALAEDGDWCESKDTESNCDDTNDICKWDATESKCKTNCDGKDATKCNSILKCTYDIQNDKCIEKQSTVNDSSKVHVSYDIPNDVLPHNMNDPGQIRGFGEEKYNAPYMNFSITPSKNDDGNILEDGSYFHGHEHVHKSNVDYPCIFRDKTSCYDISGAINSGNVCLYDTVSSDSRCSMKDNKITHICRNREYVNVKVINKSHWLDGFVSAVNIRSIINKGMDWKKNEGSKKGMSYDDLSQRESNIHGNDRTVDSKEQIDRDSSATIKVYEGGYLEIFLDKGAVQDVSKISFDKLKENSKKNLNKYYNEAVIDVLDGHCSTISSDDCDDDSSYDGDVAWEWG